jgi:sigma-54 specific flagellar transcriptional regulator A
MICATNRNLEAMVKAGTFRLDLYYRLKGVVLEMPPLRERRADIPTLVRFFCRTFAPSGSRPKRFSREAMSYLVRYSWPGNVRELENFVRSVLLFVDGDRIRLADVRQFDDFFAGGELLSDAPAFFADYVERTPGDADERTHVALDTGRTAAAPAEQSTAAFAQWAIASNLGLHELKRDLEVALIRQALVDSDGNISQSAKLLDMKRPRLSQIVNSTPELLELRERLARKSGEA